MEKPSICLLGNCAILSVPFDIVSMLLCAKPCGLASLTMMVTDLWHTCLLYTVLPVGMVRQKLAGHVCVCGFDSAGGG